MRQNQLGVSRGIRDEADCIMHIQNVACKQEYTKDDSFREGALKIIALTRSAFQPQMH